MSACHHQRVTARSAITFLTLPLVPSPPSLLSVLLDLLPQALPVAGWLGPYLKALDPQALSVVRTAQALLQQVGPLLAVTHYSRYTL